MRLLLCVFTSLFLLSCAHQNSASMREAHIDGKEALASFAKTHPELKEKINSSVAYVIYPSVGKGAVGVGGAYGKGEVYEKIGPIYKRVGYSELTQISAGLQLGGQTFGEVVFFETADAFAKFKRSEIEFSADLSAVAAKKGSAVKASHEGCSIFIVDPEGLMAEVSVGGQKLSYFR